MEDTFFFFFLGRTEQVRPGRAGSQRPRLAEGLWYRRCGADKIIRLGYRRQS